VSKFDLQLQKLSKNNRGPSWKTKEWKEQNRARVRSLNWKQKRC